MKEICNNESIKNNNLYDIWESVYEGMIERYAMSIYNRIEACIESNGCLTNY